MCGIVGIISRMSGGLYYSHMDILKGMLVTDTVRGEDSTGAYVINRNGGADMIKVASNPFHLFQCPEWENFQKVAIREGMAVIGHNRKATHGAINSANAHPFHAGKYVLVHNGTLRGDWRKLADKQVDVDSFAICHAFEEKGHEEVIPTLQGAFALVFYNIETKKLYAIRNEERPLHLIETKDFYVLSSESWIGTNHVQREKVEVKSVKLLEAGVLYEFDPAKPAEEPVTKKLNLYTPPVTSYSGNFQGGNGRHYGSSGDWGNHRNYGPAWTGDDDDMSAAAWEEYLTSRAMERVREQTVSNVAHLRESQFGKRNLPYSKGDIVQLRPKKIAIEGRWMNSQNVQWPKLYASIVGFGKEPIDAVGWMPSWVKPTDHKEWLDSFLVGEVDDIRDMVCGVTAWVKDFELDDTVKCMDGVEVGDWMWSQQVAGQACDKCGINIHPMDNLFTSVNLKNNRKHCHNCVIDSMSPGEIRENLIQRRNAAVQARIQQRQEPVGSTQPAILLPGPAAVQ